MTSTTFVQSEINKTWERLSVWQANIDVKMTKDRYFEMCRQMEEEPNPRKIPPDTDDFPVDVQKAINIFNMLGDRIFADIGYLGKDYSQLHTFMDIYEVQDRKIFLETLLRLDQKLIEKSQAEMKAARDKLKRS